VLPARKLNNRAVSFRHVTSSSPPRAELAAAVAVVPNAACAQAPYRHAANGERGQKGFAEAARLFSTEEPQYAFGDFDERPRAAAQSSFRELRGSWRPTTRSTGTLTDAYSVAHTMAA
jgi:hypothetical protein